ncbi:P-loop containing nucleoside triphosphate hydrolase protein [Hortaea werneckii]|uniref:Novel STAND NTPase 5 domain-containing protein n=1 Tax=Hortaea werneckii TaxID=91943 RepID=A0A3M7EYW0_HORWE|nr:P-loop containing nucleoside triphosphate hydrolase protein [Hortaea werneckii]KAI7570960.1 P-loop containing nucleoside triphosphate hydrolase protein [Hortaea werneckii]KAI7626570.1 P-loop containing nucleoside triphosphate hydrolase protein [Hortaea werneckii]KAI7633469.1 P-loop containing nucleoside triphosphate hydrolase protein [Hortaea werneckii]KAI7681511.1 P-loop containing nucleoside triphosphate hydrolase protein [Hortaea werneckii]
MSGPVQVVDLASSPGSTQTRLPASSHRLPTVSASAALQDLESYESNKDVDDSRSSDAKVSKDALQLPGGFEKNRVTEVWGPSGAGKTALLLQIAAERLRSGKGVTWIDADTPLVGKRLSTLLKSGDTDDTQSSEDTSLLTDRLKRFRHHTAPTLSHLLALVLHARPDFPPEGTSLLVIDGLNTLIDLDYPRFAFAGTAKTEQQKWQAGRRYAVLGSLVSGLNKMAVLNNLAVAVSIGCASRTRSDSGLGSALVPGVGGGEWDSGVWTRLAVFRDFSGRFVGVQKCQGRSLIPRDETGETGNVICFEIFKSGKIRAKEVEASAQSTGVNVLRSPAKARKRTFEEIADSEGEDVDEYGWADGDEDALPGSGDETEGPA